VFKKNNSDDGTRVITGEIASHRGYVVGGGGKQENFARKEIEAPYGFGKLELPKTAGRTSP